MVSSSFQVGLFLFPSDPAASVGQGEGELATRGDHLFGCGVRDQVGWVWGCHGNFIQKFWEKIFLRFGEVVCFLVVGLMKKKSYVAGFLFLLMKF